MKLILHIVSFLLLIITNCHSMRSLFHKRVSSSALFTSHLHTPISKHILVTMAKRYISSQHSPPPDPFFFLYKRVQKKNNHMNIIYAGSSHPLIDLYQKYTIIDPLFFKDRALCHLNETYHKLSPSIQAALKQNMMDQISFFTAEKVLHHMKWGHLNSKDQPIENVLRNIAFYGSAYCYFAMVMEHMSEQAKQHHYNKAHINWRFLLKKDRKNESVIINETHAKIF